MNKIIEVAEDMHLPSSVCFRVTRYCNARCGFCLAPPDGEHPAADILKQRIDWLLEHGVRTIHFCGGEPTIHPALAELISHVRRRHAAVIVTTNGIDLPSALRNHFRTTRTRVKVSLHGDQEHHDKMLGRPAFAQTAANLRALIADGITTSVQTTLVAGGEWVLDWMTQYCLDLEVKQLVLLPFIPRGSGTARSAEFGLSLEQRTILHQSAHAKRKELSGRLDLRFVDYNARPIHVLEADGRLILEGATEALDKVLFQVPDNTRSKTNLFPIVSARPASPVAPPASPPSSDISDLLGAIEDQRMIIDARLTSPAQWRGRLRREAGRSETPIERQRFAAAFDFLRAEAAGGAALNIDLIRRIHDQAVGGVEFRRCGVRIGRFRQFPSGCRVAELCSRLVEDISSSIDPTPLLAARAHLGFLNIHPFRDGNGRTARLLASFLLMRAGYRSTLLTAVEEHAGLEPRKYAAALEQFRDGKIQDAAVCTEFLRRMADASRWAAWFRRREISLRLLCRGLALTREDEERELIDYDLGFNGGGRQLAALADSAAPPWHRIKSELGSAALRELSAQLDRLRAEEASGSERIVALEEVHA